MEAMYLSEFEKEALKSIDLRQLEKLVEQALLDERASVLRQTDLVRCGDYVRGNLGRFERDLADYAKAKAVKKRASTQWNARRSGHDLVYAVQHMLARMKREEEESELLWIDDLIMPPSQFSAQIDARVGYRWRTTTDDAWKHGSIRFIYDVDLRPDYSLRQPKRKPSRAKLEDDRQQAHYRHWEHLVRLARSSVHDFFKAGGAGSEIPATFKVKSDTYSRGLNNFSCDFWPRKR